jgi:hypothetical protein
LILIIWSIIAFSNIAPHFDNNFIFCNIIIMMNNLMSLFSRITKGNFRTRCLSLALLGVLLHTASAADLKSDLANAFDVACEKLPEQQRLNTGLVLLDILNPLSQALKAKYSGWFRDHNMEDTENLLRFVFEIFSKIAMDAEKHDDLRRLVSALENVEPEQSSALVLPVVRACVEEMGKKYNNFDFDDLQLYQEQTEMSFAEILHNVLTSLIVKLPQCDLIELLFETKKTFAQAKEDVQQMEERGFFFWLVNNYEEAYPHKAAQKKEEWLAKLRDTEADPLETGVMFEKLLVDDLIMTSNIFPETPEFNENYYTVLGLTDEAKAKQISQAYRKITRNFHADRVSRQLRKASTEEEKQKMKKEYQDKFYKMTRIKDVLLDARSRSCYDLWLNLPDNEKIKNEKIKQS